MSGPTNEQLYQEIILLRQQVTASLSPQNIFNRLMLEPDGSVMTELNATTGRMEVMLDVPGAL